MIVCLYMFLVQSVFEYLLWIRWCVFKTKHNKHESKPHAHLSFHFSDTYLSTHIVFSDVRPWNIPAGSILIWLYEKYLRGSGIKLYWIKHCHVHGPSKQWHCGPKQYYLHLIKQRETTEEAHRQWLNITSREGPAHNHAEKCEKLCFNSLHR